MRAALGRSWSLGAALGLLACGASPELLEPPTSKPHPRDTDAGVQAPSQSAGDAAVAEPSGDASTAAPELDVLESCKPAEGTTGAPSTILETVDLINGLPMPVTIPCFLHALERPLQLQATFSVISAQPADGYRSPRLFLLTDAIVLSVVPDGDAKDLLEIGEARGTQRSIKAEIHFPVEAPMEHVAPFERIARVSGGTACVTCHGSEEPAADYGVEGAFESVAYRVNPQYEVNFDYVVYQADNCDAAVEPERCLFYKALFGYGEVVRGDFPSDMPQFF